jgi:hypothetical protein
VPRHLVRGVHHVAGRARRICRSIDGNPRRRPLRLRANSLPTSRAPRGLNVLPKVAQIAQLGPLRSGILNSACWSNWVNFTVFI